MTKQELKQYRHLLREIERLTLELEAVRVDMAGIRSAVLSYTPKTPHHNDRKPELLDKLAELERLLDSKIDARHDLRIRIETAIDSLPPLEAGVIRMYYVDGLKWERIARECNYSVQRIWQLHGTALLKIRDN